VTTASAPSFGYMPDSGGYAVREMSAKNMAMQVAAPGYDMVSDSYAPLPTFTPRL
jgi:hypothetical protein